MSGKREHTERPDNFTSPVWKYRGWDITIDSSGMFEASRPDQGNRGARSQTFDGIQRAIDGREAIRRREAAEVLSLPVYQAKDQSSGTITGLHSGDGSIKVETEGGAVYWHGGWGSEALYPDTPYVQQLVSEVKAAYSVYYELNKKLEAFRIDRPTSNDLRDFSHAVQVLKENYTKSFLAAEEAAEREAEHPS